MNNENISGAYIYRSLLNDQSLDQTFDNLEFGRGVMDITQRDGAITGSLEMGKDNQGNDYRMTLTGTVNSSETNSFLRMTGYGVPGTVTEGWVYDYFGMVVPTWPEGIGQLRTITGSVIRSADHGASKAGVTATFYMVVTGS